MARSLVQCSLAPTRPPSRSRSCASSRPRQSSPSFSSTSVKSEVSCSTVSVGFATVSSRQTSASHSSSPSQLDTVSCYLPPSLHVLDEVRDFFDGQIRHRPLTPQTIHTCTALLPCLVGRDDQFFPLVHKVDQPVLYSLSKPALDVALRTGGSFSRPDQS